MTISIESTAEQEQVAALLATATPEAAADLRDLAAATAHKEIRKAARRALYSLAQRRIVPPSASLARASSAQSPKLQAFASAYDGAGNRAILLAFSDPDGGSPRCVQFLTNDETGIQEFGARKLARREMADLVRHLEDQLDAGVAYAAIEADYGRHLLHAALAINRRRKTAPPQGALEWLQRAGSPEEEYPVAPVYARLARSAAVVADDRALERALESQQEVLNGAVDDDDPELVRDADALFQLPWFDPWFLEVEQVMPWLDRLLTGIGSADDAPEVERRARADQATAEAIDALIAGETRSRYVRRLEETADILLRRGETRAAHQALHHARELQTDQPASRIQFARRLVERTFTVALTMQASQPEDPN